jgi:acyl-CoA synthetase (AMP-forming)/AMP-acid ligase II
MSTTTAADAMHEHDRPPPEVGERWRRNVVLKRDIFSIVERGAFHGPDGDLDAVLRRIDEVPWWTFVFARNFLAREARALAVVGPLGIAPLLYFIGRRVLVRRWIDGVPLHIARPVGDRAYFRSARDALRKLHGAGFTHNDLAKEQNWLRGADGRAYLTDFQLATHAKRGWFFRLAAYEDLRHYLKHKRSYVPEALTATERRILARKTWLTTLWMATGKKVYIWVTRGLFRFTDREGGGPRLVNDAPAIGATLRSHAQVRDVVVLAFPDRRHGTGLYAFIEGKAGADEGAIHDFIVASVGRDRAPERMQLVDTLPRRADGSVHIEILQLIAMNQLDQVDSLIANEDERRIVARIVADRRNLRDRFTF